MKKKTPKEPKEEKQKIKKPIALQSQSRYKRACFIFFRDWEDGGVIDWSGMWWGRMGSGKGTELVVEFMSFVLNMLNLSSYHLKNSHGYFPHHLISIHL